MIKSTELLCSICKITNPSTGSETTQFPLLHSCLLSVGAPIRTTTIQNNNDFKNSPSKSNQPHRNNKHNRNRPQPLKHRTHFVLSDPPAAIFAPLTPKTAQNREPHFQASIEHRPIRTVAEERRKREKPPPTLELTWSKRGKATLSSCYRATPINVALPSHARRRRRTVPEKAGAFARGK